MMIISVEIAGIALALVTEQTGSIWSSVMIHCLYNILSGESQIFHIDVAQNFPAIWMYTVNSKNMLLTGINGSVGFTASIPTMAGFTGIILMVIYDEKKKILFAGDHILGLITPNISIEISMENPLQQYFDSLKKVDKLDVELLLTAHGTPVKDMHERIAELFKHHEQRLAEVESILNGQWKTAYNVAADMTWEIDCKCWDDFPLPQKWFASGEAAAHLQYLYFSGRIDREEKNGIYYYKN